MTRRARLALLSLLIASILPALAACGGGSDAAGPAPTSTGSDSATHRTRSNPWVPHHVSASTARWHLPVAVGREAVVPLGAGRVLLAGGLLAGDASTGQTLKVDLAHGRVVPDPALAVPVHDVAGGLLGRRPLVAGGGNATEQDVVQALRGGAWHVVGHLPTTRSDLSVVPTARGPWVVGGYDGSGTPTALLRLGPGGSVSPVGRLALGVRYAATAVLDHTAYVFGGEVLGRELGAVQAVDLRTGRTRVVGRLPVPLGHAMAATEGRRILLMGGRVTPDRQTAAMWWFDPRSGRFTPAGRLPHPLSDAGVATDRHRVWLLGGEDPGVTGSVVFVKVA